QPRTARPAAMNAGLAAPSQAVGGRDFAGLEPPGGATAGRKPTTPRPTAARRQSGRETRTALGFTAAGCAAAEAGEKTGPRGKSGHRRAGWSGNPTRGNPRESATEMTPPKRRALT